MHRGQQGHGMCILTAASWTARTPLPVPLFIACVCNKMYINSAAIVVEYQFKTDIGPKFNMVSERF